MREITKANGVLMVQTRKYQTSFLFSVLEEFVF